jgi:hypothetical protein
MSQTALDYQPVLPTPQPSGLLVACPVLLMATAIQLLPAHEENRLW